MKLFKLSVKIFLLFLTITVVLAFLFFIYSGTSHFEKTLKTVIEDKISQVEGCDLSIGELRFSPYKMKLTLKDLQFKCDAEGLLIENGHVDEIKIWFPFTRLFDLFRKKITIKKIIVKSPGMDVSLPNGIGEMLLHGKEGRSWAPESLEIRNLTVASGQISFQEKSIPIDLSLHEMKIEMHSGILSSKSVLSSHFLIDQLGRLRNKEGDLNILCEKKKDVINVKDLSIAGEWGIFHAQGFVIPEKGYVFDLALSSEIESAAFAEIMEPSYKIAGKVKLDGSLKGNWKDYEFLGFASSEKILAYGVAGENLRAELKLSPGRISIKDIICSLLGGEIRADLDGYLKDRGKPFAVKVDLHSLDLGKARDLFVEKDMVPVDGFVSGNTDILISMHPFALVEGEIHLVVKKKETESSIRMLNLEGEIEASIKDGTIQLEHGVLRTGSSQLSAHGPVYPPERSDLQFQLQSEEIREFSSIASSMPVIQRMGEQIQRVFSSLKGKCEAKGKAKFGPSPIIDATYDFSGLSIMDLEYGEMEGSLFIDDHRLSIPSLKINGEGGKADMHIFLDLPDYRSFELHGEIKGFPASHLLKIMGREGIQIETKADIQCSISSLNGNTEGELNLRLDGGKIYGQGFDYAEAAIDFVDGRVLLSHFELCGLDGLISASGAYGIADRTLSMKLKGEQLELSEVSAFQSESVSLKGRFDFEGEISLAEEKLKGKVKARSNELFYNGIGTGQINLEIVIDHPHVMFKGDLESLHAALSGIVLLEKNLPFEGTIDLKKSDISAAGRSIGLSSSLDTSGFISAGVSFSGEMRNLDELKVSGEVSEFELKAGGKVYRNASALPIRYTSGEVRAEDLLLLGENTNLNINALIDIPGDKMNLKISGDFDLSILQAFTKEISSSGRGHLEVFSEGKFKNPDLRGSIKIADGRIRHFALPYPIEKLSIQAQFDRDFVNFTSIAFDFGGGEIKGNGIASIEKLGYDIYSFELKGNDISLKFPEGLKYLCDGELLVRGDRESSIISGDINIIRGVYFKDIGAEMQLLSGRAREYQPFETKRMPENVYLDLDVIAQEGFWIKNDMAHAELGGNLHIGGDLGKVEVTGRLFALEGGTLKYGDVELSIREGYIDFTDITKINPSIDISAETIIEDYQINVRIIGNMETLQVQLNSNPSLPEQDIIALLLTGTTIESLYQQGSTANVEDLATGYVAGRLSGKLEKQLKQKFGMEKIQLDPMLIESQADPTARVTFGKKLSDDLMIVYSTYIGGNEENAYELEYRILKNLNFIAERTDEGAIGGDLRYRRHFRFQDGREKGQPAAQKLGKVRNVSIESDCMPDAKKLLRRIPLRKGKEFRRQLVSEGMEKIHEYLVKQGFLKATVKHGYEKAADGYEIHYSIKCGKKVNITINGCTRNEEKEIRKKISALAVESVFPQELASEIETMISDRFQNDGYFAVDVSGKETIFEDEEELLFTIDKGEQVQVDKIIISGNKTFTEEKIKKQMLSREDSLFTRDMLKPDTLRQDILAIKNLYMENGYMNVSLQEPAISISPNGKKGRVFIEIDEGNIVNVSEIVFEGNKDIQDEELLKVISSRAAAPLIASKILDDKSLLKQYYDFAGFPEVKISSNTEISISAARVTFTISEGTRKKVGDIAITGNRLTKENVIRRKLLFKSGENLSQEKLLESQHALYKLGIFKNVTISRSSSKQPEIDSVNVSVEEADNIRISVGGGYDNLSGPRGYFEISDNNFFGYNRHASFSVRGSEKDSRIQVILRKPKFFSGKELPGFRRNIDTILSTYWERERKESFTVRRVESSFQVAKRLNPVLARYLRFNFQNVNISDLRISLEEFEKEEPKLENLKLSDIGFSLIRDTRNDPFQPERGTYAIADARLFTGLIGSDEDFAKLFLQGSYFKNVGHGFTFASYIRAGFAHCFRDTQVIPLSERFFAGGAYTIRGFERDEVGPKDPITGKPLGGESVFIINEELHVPIYGKLKGVLFYDAGNVYLRIPDTDITDLRHVLGAGLRLETAIGPLRIEYGRKLDRKDFESKDEFFISIGQLF